MPLHRFEFKHRDAKGQLIRREYRYVQRRGATVRWATAAEAAVVEEPELTPEEEAMLQELRKLANELSKRVAALEDAPRAAALPPSLARDLADIRAAQMQILKTHGDHEDRLARIERTLAALGEAAEATARRAS